MTNRINRFAMTLLPFIMSIGSGCQPAPSPQADSAWAADSISREAEIAKWLADSAVRDSVSRLVNTDSLYRLYHAMLNAPDPHDLLQPRACEGYRLVYRYGVLPVELAVKRMEDTVWRRTPRAQLERVKGLLGRFTEINLDNQICAISGPRGPRIINGAHMSEMTDKPPPLRR
jgi:hypothetical protein